MNKICYYGFDKLGFELPEEKKQQKGVENHYIAYNNKSDLEQFDGIVIPNGIFEKFNRSFYGFDVKYDKDLLLDIERQVFNLVKTGRWCCFLVSKPIVRKLKNDDISHTDLCKKILKQNKISTYNSDGGVSDLTIQNEFVQYIRKYGVSKTFFISDKFMLNDNIRKIASTDNRKSATSFEVDNGFFFLQFHTIHKQEENLLTLSEILSRSIINYRAKRIIDLPDWADDFKFNTEFSLENKIEKINEEYTILSNDLNIWKNFKLMLTTSGENLRRYVMNAFEDFFNEKLNPDDNFIEDFKVLNENGDIDYIVEVKGVNKGIKREYINQLDSHRERNDLHASIPGVLIINNQMTICDIQKRQKTIIPQEHIIHAKNLNILIIRTIDFLYLIKQLENKENKQALLHEIIYSKGGWLKVDNDKYKIINGH